MQQIAADIVRVLADAGYARVVVEQSLAPPWTTDWMEPDAKRRLIGYGIASPDAAVCPQCGSDDVAIVSEFGSTACKSLLRCRACGEPFDQFKRF